MNHEHHWAFFNDQMRECRPGCGAIEPWPANEVVHQPEGSEAPRQCAFGIALGPASQCREGGVYRCETGLPDDGYEHGRWWCAEHFPCVRSRQHGHYRVPTEAAHA